MCRFVKYSSLKKVFTTVFLASCLSHEAMATSHPAKNFISYTDNGTGQPLVLIHAFPTDKRLWEPQTRVLKKYFRVITLDLWGFGQSSAVDGQAITMTQYADEVHTLLQRLHIQHAIIGGESMGGYVALAYLAHYPASVNGIVLSDTQASADSLEVQAKRETTAIDVLKNGTAQLIHGFMSKALTPNASNQTREFLQTIVKAQTATADASALRGMAKRTDTSALLTSTELPILIISGKNDTLIPPQQSEAMHKLAKNSRLVLLANAAHLSNLEQPNQWNDAVISMFSRSNYSADHYSIRGSLESHD